MLDELKIVRITDLLLIPKYLLEQVKDVYWTVDELMGIWPTIEKNPTNLLFAIVDHDHHIKGVIWATASLAGSFLFVNVVSLDKAWQGKGLGKSLIMPYLRGLKEKLKLRHLLAISSRPKAMGMGGWQIAKYLMEG